MTVSGVGIHSGLQCSVRLLRTDTPVQFSRAGTLIPAASTAVVATQNCTTLGARAQRVAMVEHLLAALHATGFWSGVTIEVTAEELPILDGSAEPWLEAISELGEPPPPPAPLQPARAVHVTHGGGWASYRPGEDRLTVEVDFPHPAIGRQHWSGTAGDHAAVLGARTFGFLQDFERLKANGLALGASLDNALVFGEQGPLAPPRFTDEPVRHKVLDALGDLFLLQAPLAGGLHISRGSHALHDRFVSELLAAAEDAS
jgi:UDP-3-O-[3-hydroxymyristoyl] N-acetylglucosamine deacetylase